MDIDKPKHIITTVHNNGIVNVQGHYDDGIQIIWNNQLNLVSKTAKKYEAFERCDIRKFRAIYVDGVMVVKNGKVWPRKSFFKAMLGHKE